MTSGRGTKAAWRLELVDNEKGQRSEESEEQADRMRMGRDEMSEHMRRQRSVDGGGQAKIIVGVV